MSASVKKNMATLPDDIEALKALVIERDALVVKQAEQIAALQHNLGSADPLAR